MKNKLFLVGATYFFLVGAAFAQTPSPAPSPKATVKPKPTPPCPDCICDGELDGPVIEITPAPSAAPTRKPAETPPPAIPEDEISDKCKIMPIPDPDKEGGTIAPPEREGEVPKIVAQFFMKCRQADGKEYAQWLCRYAYDDQHYKDWLKAISNLLGCGRNSKGTCKDCCIDVIYTGAAGEEPVAQPISGGLPATPTPEKTPRKF